MSSPLVSINQQSQRGNTLLLSLLMTLASSMIVSSFLFTLTQEYEMTHRTYYHANALYVAEAGTEEAMAMINYGDDDWAAGGWSTLGSGDYTKTVSNFTSLAGASAIGTYVVTVYGATNTHPVIVCTGIVDSASASFGGGLNTNVTRTVRAVLGNRATFQWGLLAQGSITLNGNASLDSYDSSDTTSTHSDYDVAKGYGTYNGAKRNDNGDAATNGNLTNIVVLGNADVYGHVMTGTGGTISVGPNGFVGSLSNHPSGVSQADRISHSMNVDLPLPTVPFSSGINLGAISGGSSTTITGGAGSPVDYQVSSVSVTGNGYLTFSGGYTRLYITGDFSTAGNAYIVVDAGSKVEIYVGGSTSIAGNGLINNAGVAQTFQVYNLGTQPTSISGNGDFLGCVYAPGSVVSLSGNGTTYGAVVGSSFSITGNATFHYDEALKKTGPMRGYSVLAWQEM